MADFNQIAHRIVREASDPDIPRTLPKDGSRGSKGGSARAQKLTPERRSEIAKTAAAARWDLKANLDARKAKAAKMRAKRAAGSTKGI
ncbi:MAG TPA: hypothetical protein VND98_02085 [Solirubrobacterales bacterium]|nr:hypothetical protein [Solirubrobacterales bacterium]